MQTPYNKKMHTVDKYGWTILEGDTGYSLPESVRTSMVAQGPVEKYVQEKKVAVEIGVYYGFTTRWLSGIFDVVHTFDLKNAVLECFEINMKNFKCNNVISHGHGLGSENAVVDYPYSEDTSTYMNLGNMERFTPKKQQIKKLDDCNIGSIDFIMIDTEGYGANVVKGATKTILDNKPVIVCKTDGAPALLNNLGYSFIQQVSKNDALYLHKDQV